MTDDDSGTAAPWDSTGSVDAQDAPARSEHPPGEDERGPREPEARPGAREPRLREADLSPLEPVAHSAATCVNCGAGLQGAYCHECGQVAHSRIEPFRELVADVAGDTLGYDSRMWRTLRRLVLSPGFLSREYVLGRRVRYTPPFRLYLVVSLLTFLALSLIFETVTSFISPEGPAPEPPATGGPPADPAAGEAPIGPPARGPSYTCSLR